VAVIMVMAATAVILSMTTAINAHVVCLADVRLSWHLREFFLFIYHRLIPKISNLTSSSIISNLIFINTKRQSITQHFICIQ